MFQATSLEVHRAKGSMGSLPKIPYLQRGCICSIALCSIGCSRLQVSSAANLNKALERALNLENSSMNFTLRCACALVCESGATVERKEGKQLQPSGAALLVVVDDGQNSDAMPEDAHHYQGQSLSIIQ